MQDPLNSQNHDRYSYAWNNPTTLTDPSGYSVADAVTPTFLQAACLGGASMDCWEFSAMHMIGWAIGGVNNYLNLVFSNIPTPGFDEDSTSASSPARAPSFDCDAACHRTLEAGDYPIADGRVWDPHGEVISMRGTTADREDEEFDSDAITRAELWKNWLAQFATHVQEQAAKSANSSNTRPLNVTYGVTGEAVSPRDGWGQGSPNVGVGWTPCPATRRPGSMSTGVPSTSPAH